MVSRTAAAAEAGMSAHQQKQALRVAAVPEPDFEAQVESDSPPTLTQLAAAMQNRQLAAVHEVSTATAGT